MCVGGCVGAVVITAVLKPPLLAAGNVLLLAAEKMFPISIWDDDEAAVCCTVDGALRAVCVSGVTTSAV